MPATGGRYLQKFRRLRPLLHWRLIVISIALVREHGEIAHHVILGDGRGENVHPPFFLKLEIHTLHTSYDLSQEARTSTGQRNMCIRVHKQQSDLRRAVSNWECTELAVKPTSSPATTFHCAHGSVEFVQPADICSRRLALRFCRPP